VARAVGNIDSYVTAYRGYPALLQSAVKDETLWDGLSKVLTDARDWNLVKGTALHSSSERQERRCLSRREREVLELVAQGLANKEIAAALFISEATAKVHIRHILEKLGVRTRTEAAVIAASTDSDL
jgi:DNA-binding NarL/FixJ family response regulator